MRVSPQVSQRVGLLAVLVAGCSHRTAPPGQPGAPARRQEVTSEDIARAPTQSIEQQLMAKVPGVIVGRTETGDIAIRIRGGTSAYNNEPLYVVDGQEVMPTPGGGLSGLNPNDIESIKVLKDPASMSMYGSRGGNGVIVIRTKQSSSQGKQPDR